MEKFAIVKFIGDEEKYVSNQNCETKEWLYCNDCEKYTSCNKNKFNYFKKDKEYKVYFLDYCQGKRDVLEIEAENGEILSYVPLSDFEIVLDKDKVLEDSYFVVKYVDPIKTDYLTPNNEYKVLKTDRKNKFYYVLDNSGDCYYYPKEFFQIVEK